MKIFLVRHGETDWNRAHKLQGREDIPLNTNGIRQGKLCGQALESVHFSGAFSSPLQRAVRTAELILEAGKEKHGDVPELRILEELTERDFGSAAGTDYSGRNVFAEFPRDDDAEALSDVRKRMVGAVIKAARLAGEAGAPEDGNILILSHGAAITQVLCHLGAPAGFKLINLSINVLEYKDGVLSLVDRNVSPESILQNAYKI